jgi:hypothetical protein
MPRLKGLSTAYYIVCLVKNIIPRASFSPIPFFMSFSNIVASCFERIFLFVLSAMMLNFLRTKHSL